MKLFDIGTEIDNARVMLDHADNLLILFNETMDREMEVLKDGDCWARYVHKRSSLLSSLLASIQGQIGEAMEGLAALSDAVHEDWREEKPEAAEVSQKQTGSKPEANES